MIRKIFALVVLAGLVPVLTHPAAAQTPQEQPDMTVNASSRVEVIEGVLKRLDEGYVFPDVARQMEAAIRRRQSNNEYDEITSATEFKRQPPISHSKLRTLTP